MQRVDIKIGFSCNNRCLFCVQGDKRDHHGSRPADRIRADLREGRRAGATGVVITGGEPTMQRTLRATVRAARALGYATVQVQTNGRLLAYEELCRRLVDDGANEFSPALHGSTARIHDGLTRAPGSFEQTAGGIRTLVALGQRVITNSVITNKNHEDLPALALLLVDLGVSQYQFAFVHILGTAAAHRETLVPRKRDVMPYVKRGLDVGRAAGVRCMTEAIPYCLMAGYEEHVAERIIPVTRVFDADQTVADYTAYRLTEGKAHGPPCRACALADRCEGPWREYPELYGWDEFVALHQIPEVLAKEHV
jgi:MoaA/NifB/PqqE/SkfB family radical SAM enzyme